MNILVTGAGGQLAWELERSVPSHHTCHFLSRSQLDISNTDMVNAYFLEHKVDAVINAAAYTAVDNAESDSDKAYEVNHLGPLNLANACITHGAYLLHISTDFVFNGQAYTAYQPDHECKPLGVYGKSKLQGEMAIEQSLLKNWAIIRTAWVYSSHGNNFVKTMLRLMSEKPSLGIVVDQIGTPTWAAGLADICWKSVDTKLSGIHHWSDAGVASWYDFAVAIKKIGLSLGLLARDIDISPIAASQYPTPAERPHFGVLNKDSLVGSIENSNVIHWQEQLESMMSELV